MTVANNEFTRAAYMPVRIKGNMPHGSNYWQDNGVTEPTRELDQFTKKIVNHNSLNRIYSFDS